MLLLQRPRASLHLRPQRFLELALHLDRSQHFTVYTLVGSSAPDSEVYEQPKRLDIHSNRALGRVGSTAMSTFHRAELRSIEQM